MKHYDRVIINNDKFNSFRLYQLLIEAGELKLIKSQSLPDGVQVGDIIFKNLASQYQPLEIYVKVGSLRLQVYDQNGWMCPVKTKVMLSILNLVKSLCSYFEDTDPDKKTKWDSMGQDKSSNNFNTVMNSDIMLLNALSIDIGWYRKE